MKKKPAPTDEQMKALEEAVRQLRANQRAALMKAALAAGVDAGSYGAPGDWWPQLAPLKENERDFVKTELRRLSSISEPAVIQAKEAI